MPLTSATDPAVELWRWLEDNAARLAAAYRRGELAGLEQEIDAKVAKLGPEAPWELGPHDEAGDEIFFALGCAGSRETLTENRARIALAPDIPGWALLPAKPAKRWTRRKAALRSANGERWVDFDRWGFAARRSAEGVVVRFVARDVEAFEAAELEGLAWMLLDWELGEALVIDRVSDVAVVDRLDEERPVSELGAAFHGAGSARS